MSSELKHKVSIYIFANSAESGPPLGTVLGNLGVNTVKFCKEFNEFTNGLPSYFLLGVSISIFEDRTYKFSITLPPIGYIISLLKFERTIKKNGRDAIEHCIYVDDIIKLALFKFPNYSMKRSFSIVLGTVKSAGLSVIYRK